MQLDIDYQLRNRDRFKAELRSIQQRSGTEAQQADLRARIAASEEFYLAASRELGRLGGQPERYVQEDLSSYDPYKLNPTDLNLMKLSARMRSDKEVTNEIIKTRQFIRNTTNQADAIDLIQRLEKVAGFNNPSDLPDFERLDAIREFRRTVYETRTQAEFARENLDATLADLDYTAYEIGARRVKTGATVALAVGTGALGMTAMAGEIGFVSLTAGSQALLTAQAATAGKVMMVYNLSTGAIDGYSKDGVGGALEGAGKETLPINTYIAIRDGKGGATIAVGLWQDASNALQIYSFAKTLKTAVQAKTVANVESGLDGADAALNRSWKLDQATTDFMATQMNLQATVLNTTLEDPPPATGRAAGGGVTKRPQAASSSGTKTAPTMTAPAIGSGSIPMGDTWVAQSAGATLPMDLDAGSTMQEVATAGRELIRQLDAHVLAADRPSSAPPLTATQERQVVVLRGMSNGEYSPIVADRLLSRETGQGLAETLVNLSGVVAASTR